MNMSYSGEGIGVLPPKSKRKIHIYIYEFRMQSKNGCINSYTFFCVYDTYMHMYNYIFTHMRDFNVIWLLVNAVLDGEYIYI
jgi:hypothetical protein